MHGAARADLLSKGMIMITKNIRGGVAKFAAAALLSSALTASMSMPAHSQEVAGKLQWVLECSILVWTDPARHLEECGVTESSNEASKWIGSNSVERPHYCIPKYFLQDAN